MFKRQNKVIENVNDDKINTTDAEVIRNIHNEKLW